MGMREETEPSRYTPSTPARTMREPRTVTMVPAMAMMTAGALVTPKRVTIG